MGESQIPRVCSRAAPRCWKPCWSGSWATTSRGRRRRTASPATTSSRTACSSRPSTSRTAVLSSAPTATSQRRKSTSTRPVRCEQAPPAACHLPVASHCTDVKELGSGETEAQKQSAQEGQWCSCLLVSFFFFSKKRWSGRKTKRFSLRLINDLQMNRYAVWGGGVAVFAVLSLPTVASASHLFLKKSYLYNSDWWK